MFGIWKAGLAPVNTNYRYADDELVYLWDNADAVAVVFHGAFTPTIERIRDRVDRVRLWLWVDDGSGPCPEWAIALRGRPPPPTPSGSSPPWGRSGDHLYMLYTGGTTGMPKGVMWRQDDLFRNLVGSAIEARVREGEADLDIVREKVTKPGMVGLPACPLMHGTGCMTQLIILSGGGCVVTLESRSLDIPELLDTIDREAVNLIAIVGDAFAKPITRALDAEPDRWDLSSLLAVTSSGVMFSEPVKQGLLAHATRGRRHRRLQLLGGGRHGPVGLRRRGRGQDGHLHRRREHPGRRRGRHRRRARVGTDRPGRRRRVPAHRLLQGPRQVGRHLRHHRRQALLGPRRLRPGRGGRLDHPARAGGRCASTPAARRSSPRRWRRPSSSTPRSSTPWPSGSPTTSSARPSPAVVELAPGADLDEADVIAQSRAAWPATRRPSGSWPSTPSVGPPTARSTTSASRRGPGRPSSAG